MHLKILKIGVFTEDGEHLERVVFNNGDIQWKNKSKSTEIEGERAILLENQFRKELLYASSTMLIGKHLIR